MPKKNNYIFVSYYTPEYEGNAKKLIASLEKFGLPFIVERVESRQNWYLNVAWRPEIILKVLREFPGKDVVYTDADSEIVKYPSLFDWVQGDIGAHYLNGTQLLGGTMYWRNKPEVHRLLQDWISAQWRDFESLRQRILQNLIESGNYKIAIERIPKEYVRIFDNNKMGDAVIQHNQASRNFKRRFKMGVRHLTDGTVVLTHSDRNVEATFDKQFTKIGTLHWAPKMLDDKNIEDLKPTFEGKIAYIIGKGPSLDNLTANAFADESAPVLAINESIEKVESLDLPNPTFLMMFDSKKFKVFKSGVVVPKHIRYLYAHRPTFSYGSREIKVDKSLTALFAIEICKILGTVEFQLISFDACVNKNTAYAECVGTKSDAGARNPNRFLTHRGLIDKATKDFKTTFVLPIASQPSQ